MEKGPEDRQSTAGTFWIHTRKGDDHMNDSLIGKVAKERHSDLVREADRRRLARRLGRARRSSTATSPGARTDGQVSRDIEIRWGLEEDETRIGEILDLNGMPRRVALEEQFIVAEEHGEVLAAVSFMTTPKRLLLGIVVADPWAGERNLAVALYTGVRGLADEMGVRDILARPDTRTNYLREAGYRRRIGRWKLRVVPRPGARR